MQEIQRRVTDGELGHDDIYDIIWEHLKPPVDDLIAKADVPLYTDDEIEQAEINAEKYRPIIQALTPVAYGLSEFDTHSFREQLKSIGIYHGYA